MKITDVYKLVKGPLKIEKVRCETTGMAVEGPFVTPTLFQLKADELVLVESLIINGGNLKKVALDLSVSYPTLRNRLDGVIGFLKNESEKLQIKRSEILDAIEKGTLTPEEGAQKMETL